MDPTAERCVVFECAGDACVGILHPVASPASDLGVLIVVGGPQYRVGSHRQFVMLAREFASNGHPAFRFDYRGMGDSYGVERDFQFVADDVRCAIDAFLRSGVRVRRIVIFGLCDAASAALMYATSDARVAGIILANPWVRTEVGLARAHVQHYYRGRIFQRTFWKKVLGGRFEVRRAFGSFIAALAKVTGAGPGSSDQNSGDFVGRMLAGFEGFYGPVLLLLSGRDLTAREFESLGVRDARWSSALARPGVSREQLPNADHTFSGRDAESRMGRLCTAWISRELPGSTL